MGGDGGVVEQDVALRIDAAGNGGGGEFLGVLPDGDRVQVHDAVDIVSFFAARSSCIFRGAS